MADISFDDVLKLAEQLPEAEQNRLIYNLRLKQQVQKPRTPVSDASDVASDRWYAQRGSEYVDSYRNPTREELVDDADILRQTPARAENRLLGKYANPDIADMSEQDFHAQMHVMASKWEQELDELDTDES